MGNPTFTQRARSQAQKRQRYLSILQAAERLLTTMPYASLTMSGVAQEAGLSKGTLYLYFDTKDELLLRLLTVKLYEWSTDLRQRLSEGRPDHIDDLAVLITQTVEQHVLLRKLLIMSNTIEAAAIKSRVGRQSWTWVLRTAHVLATELNVTTAVMLRVMDHLYRLVVGWSPASPVLPERIQEASADVWPYPQYPQLNFRTEVGLVLRIVLRELLPETWKAQRNPV